jgi:hypothetical protein
MGQRAGKNDGVGPQKGGLFPENILPCVSVEATLGPEVQLCGGGAVQAFLHADVKNILSEALAELTPQNSVAAQDFPFQFAFHSAFLAESFSQSHDRSLLARIQLQGGDCSPELWKRSKTNRCWVTTPLVVPTGYAVLCM